MRSIPEKIIHKVSQNYRDRIKLKNNIPIKFNCKNEPDLDLLNVNRTKKNYNPVEKPNYINDYEIKMTKGRPYKNIPLRIELKKGKTYFWCRCGLSKNQPFCDGEHRMIQHSRLLKTTEGFSPLKFKVENDGHYWLCNCKQTDKEPFCDGSHKKDQVQNKFNEYGFPVANDNL